MTLTSNDYLSLATLVAQGQKLIEYVKDQEVLWLECDYEEEGYTEDDYFNGTGAFVCTGINLTVHSAYSTDVEGEETLNDFSEKKLYNALC